MSEGHVARDLKYKLACLAWGEEGGEEGSRKKKGYLSNRQKE